MDINTNHHAWGEQSFVPTIRKTKISSSTQPPSPAHLSYHNWWNTTLRHWKHLVGLKQPKMMMTGLNPCLSLVCLLQPKSSGFVANGASAEFCLLLQNCSRRLERAKIPLLKPEQQRYVSSGRKLAYGWKWEHLIIIVCTLTREHGLTECSIGWKRQFCGQKL